ncbi:MAG: hypothetical protein WC637_15570 [Victivallales bacterium]|jgi:hypothetical protein
MKMRIMFVMAAMAAVAGISLSAQEAALPSMDKAVLWVKADALKMKDGEKIATVKDLSGKNNDLTAPADKQPTFKEKGAGGKPTIAFSNSYFDVKPPVKPSSEAYSMFILVSESAPAWQTFVATEGYRFQSNNYSVKDVSNIGEPDKQQTFPAIYELIQSDANGILYINGSKIGDPAGHPSIESKGFRIGYDDLSKIGTEDALVGAIYEIIIYKGALSDADRIKVEQYLKTKYGVK